MSKKFLNLLLVIMMLAILVPTTLAAPPAQEGQDYIVVADDWLSKLADKYLGNPFAYPAIVEYTNQKHAEDASYAEITDPDLIEVGWKIYIPSAEEAATIVAAAPAAPAAPTTFSIAVGIDPDTMDPVQNTTTTVTNMVEYMAQTLLIADKEGNPQPQLATDWEISDDGLEYTFHLREGVTFHDGTVMDAEAIKWNLDRILDPDLQSPGRSTFAVIEEIEVVNEYTLKLHLSETFPPLLAAFSGSGNALIISPASVDQEGNSYENITQPVGTGPYIFKERVKGERIVVTKNENYWGEEPYYDEVVFRIVPEAATRESLLLAGQVDLIILPPISDLPALQQNPDVEVLLAPSIRTIFIAINTTDEVLSDVRVRQALNYAVDKQAIIDSVLFGAGQALDAPMSPSLYGYCPQTPYEYNPEKARELLAEAGAESIELGFISPTGRYVQDFQASQAIAGYLSEVGIKSTVETMDWPSYVAAILTPAEENTLDLHLLGWAPDFLDAHQQMLQFDSS